MAIKKIKKATAQKKSASKKVVTKKVVKTILGKSEPLPFAIENISGTAPCVIICDHASNRVPKSLKNLGLKKSDLEKHIAWDPGTADIGRYLSDKIDATAFLSTYSRLVVDLNRGPKAAECMRKVSDHVMIPGNQNLSAADKNNRLEEIFWPYHDALDFIIEDYLEADIHPLIISLHSFTPEMNGIKRPWHMGVLWNKEDKLAKKLIAELRRQNPKLIIGANEPYSLKADNVKVNTISTHAESRGLPYITLEFRQDLVDTKAKAEKWSRLLLRSLAPILLDSKIYRQRVYKK